MSWARQRKPSRMAQAVAILALLLTVPLGIEYMRQGAVRRGWERSGAQARLELATAESVGATLEARKALVQTDRYIEQAARAQLRWAHPGEVLVIVVSTVAPELPTPQSEPTATPTPEPRSLLGRLFGG